MSKIELIFYEITKKIDNAKTQIGILVMDNASIRMNDVQTRID